MIPFDHWYLPDGETHLQTWMSTINRRVDGRLTYQYHKYEAALKFCTQRRRAVDVGAHAGLWSYWMARDFARLDAFEPVPEHRRCWLTNLMGLRDRAALHPCALGNRTAMVAMTTGPSSTGDTYVDPTKPTGLVPMVPLDSFPQITDVDLLKVDCEGGELYVLQGAEQLLRRDAPVIVVEQKLGHGQKYGIDDRAALTFLQTLGYRRQEELSGDFILTRQP